MRGMIEIAIITERAALHEEIPAWHGERRFVRRDLFSCVAKGLGIIIVGATLPLVMGRREGFLLVLNVLTSSPLLVII